MEKSIVQYQEINSVQYMEKSTVVLITCRRILYGTWSKDVMVLSQAPTAPSQEQKEHKVAVEPLSMQDILLQGQQRETCC